MKYYVFKRDSDNFDDILEDVALKPIIRHKIKSKHQLILGFADEDEKIMSYMTIKYGDDMTSFDKIVPDRTPVMGKDYMPVRRGKYKKTVVRFF